MVEATHLIDEAGYIERYLEALTPNSLRRILDTPLTNWADKQVCTKYSLKRCLIGHGENWVFVGINRTPLEPLAPTFDKLDIQAATTFDQNVRLNGLHHTVKQVKRLAGYILAKKMLKEIDA